MTGGETPRAARAQLAIYLMASRAENAGVAFGAAQVPSWAVPIDAARGRPALRSAITPRGLNSSSSALRSSVAGPLLLQYWIGMRARARSWRAGGLTLVGFGLAYDD